MEWLLGVCIFKSRQNETDISHRVFGVRFSDTEGEQVLFGFDLNLYTAGLFVNDRSSMSKLEFTPAIIKARINAAGIAAIDAAQYNGICKLAVIGERTYPAVFR